MVYCGLQKNLYNRSLGLQVHLRVEVEKHLRYKYFTHAGYPIANIDSLLSSGTYLGYLSTYLEHKDKLSHGRSPNIPIAGRIELHVDQSTFFL